jgi:hypothetical protein
MLRRVGGACYLRDPTRVARRLALTVQAVADDTARDTALAAASITDDVAVGRRGMVSFAPYDSQV